MGFRRLRSLVRQEKIYRTIKETLTVDNCGNISSRKDENKSGTDSRTVLDLLEQKRWQGGS